MSRDERAIEFLQNAGWGDAQRQPLGADASTRSYERLTLNGKTALLMNAPSGSEDPSCPPDATPAVRHHLGYNATARLAGNDMQAYEAIATALNENGLCAPKIYALDVDQGFGVIEDLGDGLYARVIDEAQANQGARELEAQLYENAALVIAHIAEQKITPHKDYHILGYDETALIAEADLLTQYYWPLQKQAPADAELIEEYRQIWREMLTHLSVPSVMVLRDFHAENLLWLPQRSGLMRTGLLDFQDALIGHPAYDIVSMVEDARRDVPGELVTHIKNYYCNALNSSAEQKDQFNDEYALLGAQRNAKILGIFARLAHRDGKNHYLDLLPRVEGHFRRNLKHPLVSPLAQFIGRHFPELKI